MTNIADIKARLAQENPDAVFWDGCDEALVGVASRPGLPELACYNYDLLVEVFTKAPSNMDDVEAMEWVDFNIVGAFVGPGTPIILEIPDEGSW